jgi:hypothetical protein
MFASCFLITLCVATVVGSGAYIAYMNHVWWKKNPPEDQP